MENERTQEQREADEIGAALFELFQNDERTYDQLTADARVSQSTLRRMFRVDRDHRDLKYVDYVKVSKALGVRFGDVVRGIEEARGGDTA